MSITDALKQDAFAQESNLPVVLIAIDHDDLASPILVANYKTDIESNGDTYVGFQFEITLPDSNEDAPPKAKLRIANVTREITEAVRSISSPASVTIKVVRQETPDIIEAEFPGMKLTDVTWDALTVEGTLEFEDLTREPYPAYTFSPANYRGIL